MVNTWKVVTAILFIFIIFENIVFLWLLNKGTEILEREDECAYSICEDYGGFRYDTYNGICYCYDGEEIKYEEQLT